MKCLGWEVKEGNKENTHTISFGWGVYKGKDGSILDYEAEPPKDESIYSSK